MKWLDFDVINIKLGPTPFYLNCLFIFVKFILLIHISHTHIPSNNVEYEFAIKKIIYQKNSLTCDPVVFGRL
jgi:hypothetical protein